MSEEERVRTSAEQKALRKAGGPGQIKSTQSQLTVQHNPSINAGTASSSVPCVHVPSFLSRAWDHVYSTLALTGTSVHGVNTGKHFEALPRSLALWHTPSIALTPPTLLYTRLPLSPSQLALPSSPVTLRPCNHLLPSLSLTNVELLPLSSLNLTPPPPRTHLLP